MSFKYPIFSSLDLMIRDKCMRMRSKEGERLLEAYTKGLGEGER